MTRRHGQSALVVSALLTLASAAGAQVTYTLQQTADHVAAIASSPYVLPTASAVALGHSNPFLIGRTPGTAHGGYLWQGQNVPQQDLLAYRVSDFSVGAPKTKIVLTAGQHADEQHSLYVLQGLVDFALSADPVAMSLRQRAEIIVYPQVNPEGNWAPGAGKTVGVGFQPEHPTEDMNRFWHVADVPSGTHNRPWSNTQIVRDAMILDTGRSNVGYVIDFHTPGPTQTGKPYIYAEPTEAAAPFADAIRANNSMTIDHETAVTGMLRSWSKSSDGLNATYSYTPEIPRQSGDNLATYSGFGQTIARALNYAILAEDNSDTTAPVDVQYKIDFNARLNPGAGWNVVGQSNSNTPVTLTDTTGQLHGASIALPTILDSATGDGWNQSAHALPAWASLGAADDYSFFQSDSVFLLTGLGAGRAFDIELLIARDLDRSSTITIAGESLAWNDRTNGYLAGDTILFQNVLADSLGRINISFDIAGTSTAINAIHITGVPEPALTAPLAAAAAITLRRRRR